MTPDEDQIGLIYPPERTKGATGVIARKNKVDEIKDLERSKELRLWEVRAYISDHVPLSGGVESVLHRPCEHQLFVNLKENPLWIYLHLGGHNAIYYGLFADAAGKLLYISVKVESCLPANALLLGRSPVNALLDVLTRDFNLPIMIQRLDLLSPVDGEVLLSELMIPQERGVLIGPLGGILQAVPFAPYDALYREALTSPSPFYRLLCAWKMYEGSGRIRGWVRRECERLGIQERIPRDPQLDHAQLVRFGFSEDFAQGITCARDLFEKLRGARDAIAHFLIDTDLGENHVYLADGAALKFYAIAASALLQFAHQAMEDLRLFCTNRVNFFKGGTIIPMPQNRDQFVVRARDYGLD